MNPFPDSTSRFSFWIGLLFGVLVLVEIPAVKAQQPASSAEAGERTPRMTPAIQAAPERVQQAVQRAFHGDDGVGKDGPMAKAGRDLIALYKQYEAGGPAAVNRLLGRGTQPKAERGSQLRTHSPVSADGRFVTVDVMATDDPSVLLNNLKQLGLRGGATAGNVVSGKLPIAEIGAAAGLASLRGMQASYARTHGTSLSSVSDSTDLVISEADTTHSAVSGRKDLGVDGSGEKICAMSDSYDNLGDASTNVSNGELPGSNNPFGHTTPVDVLDDRQESDEGRAMLQLIYDIAHGAELGFHTAFGGRANFAEGIGDLTDVGCTVIVDDVGYASQPFYQDGVVSNAVDSVVNNEDVAYFSSAGNDGKDSYEAPFRNSGNSGVINSSSVRHDFDGTSSTDTEQQITINAGGTLKIFTFQWTDPSAEVEGSSGPDTDLDIALVDDQGNIEVKKNTDNISLGIPAEAGLEFTNNTGSQGTYNLIIEKADGPDPDSIKYIYKGSGYTIEEYDTKGPTVYGHPLAKGAEAVAAAPFYYTDAYSTADNLPYLENFSSKGGIKIHFDQNGDELNTFETRNKPDLTGTDGNDNTFFGQSLSFRDPDSSPNFFGTSAAAPNVAAIAALVREQNPGYTPSDVYSHLESNAKDVTRRLDPDVNNLQTLASGDDRWSGHGFVQADAASLPVELTAFDVVAEQEAAVLEWTTASETNNAGFAVEHRREEERFEEVGFVESRASGGTTTESISYSFRTSELRVGTHHFRLRQLDLDGSATYSKTVTVEVSLSGSHRVSTVAPNPVQRRGTVSVAVNTAQQVRVAVYNVLGQRVAVLHDGVLAADDPAVLEVGEGLSSGTYLLRVTGESFAETRQFVRVR